MQLEVIHVVKAGLGLLAQEPMLQSCTLPAFQVHFELKLKSSEM